MGGKWPDDALLAEAVRWVMRHRDDGVECPCCGQFAKVYRRKLNSAMARGVLFLYELDTRKPGEWWHVAEEVAKRDDLAHIQRSREWPKAKYWGLIEEKDEEREDGGKAGWWRITAAGKEFARGNGRQPRHALVYNACVLGLDALETTDIRRALGDKFDYSELMARIHPPPPLPPPPSGRSQLSLLPEDP